jgi:hypothetical protein
MMKRLEVKVGVTEPSYHSSVATVILRAAMPLRIVLTG